MPGASAQRTDLRVPPLTAPGGRSSRAEQRSGPGALCFTVLLAAAKYFVPVCLDNLPSVCSLLARVASAGAILFQVRERYVADPITVACLTAGSFTLSAGTMDPAIVLERLLVALSVLSLAAHRRLVAPDGPFARAPEAALRDGASSWWGTEEASVFLQTVIGAINDAAPLGYACSYSDGDCIELVRLDADGTDQREFDVNVSVPPKLSAVRERVR